MIDPETLATSRVEWEGAVRIIRSRFPPIDLFEDIADPADWPLLISAEQKTNPRLMEGIGNLDLVPPERRVAGPGASYLMAPFTHASTDRPSRFSRGQYGVLYVANRFETALLETVHHHAAFMARTNEGPGWTSQFRALSMSVLATLHDLLERHEDAADELSIDDYAAAQILGQSLKAAGSDGLIYPSVRDPQGACVALFSPDLARNPVQIRHLDYHWDGQRVDLYREAGAGEVYRIILDA
ncbi:RES family NAD+ phosphorylase [Sphingomonas crocodyli]|uniref:RES domain-containing protein n=1 Tax=Sphingomonas crocodyli TaxID=1979270 RepID=A0A437LXW4_9SPHN|nr:RES family NAD+ phosphorylase [Sphingomonas crocodyli]RVT90240.1 RES domain-containing protein [Sphingomonas crocodyli]